MPPSEGSPNGSNASTGPPDRQTLRLLERTLASNPLVAATEFEPDTYEPRSLRAVLDADRYPDSVTAARVDVRWFTTGDFSIHYVEDRGDGRWECRWDRHPNPHNARDHFHPPPKASQTDAADDQWPPDHRDVCRLVLDFVEARVTNLWKQR